MNTLFNLVFGGCDMDLLNTVQFMQSYSMHSQKKGYRGHQSRMTIIDEVAKLPKNIEEMKNEPKSCVAPYYNFRHTNKTETMKRLSKMAYELRDVTIFYQRMVRQVPVKEIAFEHKRSKNQIYQILNIQKQRYAYYLDKITKTEGQYYIYLLWPKRIVQQFYHYEIGLILQRYYIRMKNDNNAKAI